MMAERHGLTTHDACHGEPADCADGSEKHVRIAAPEERREGDHEEQVRQRVEYVDRAHHGAVRAPADVAGGRAPGHADQCTYRGSEQCDRERDAGSVERTHEQIASQTIGTEPVCAVELRRHSDAGPVELVVGVGAQRRTEQRGHGDEQDGTCGDLGQDVEAQSTPGITPETAREQRAVSHGARADRAIHGAGLPSGCTAA
jgi:hypothetical protein